MTRSMDGMPPSVRNFTIRILGGLFNFGAKRGFCGGQSSTAARSFPTGPDRNPASHRGGSSGESWPQRKSTRAGLVPFLAISFFCGIRRAEALRLDWSAIDLHENFVKLPAAITKTKQGRHIEISENCRAWLAPYAKEAGRVFPFSENVLRDRLADLREKHKVPTIKHGARHSFASYWLALHGDINQLCRFLGHDDPQTTFRHYAKAATKREAQKFWAIMPKAAKLPKVVAFEQGRRDKGTALSGGRLFTTEDLIIVLSRRRTTTFPAVKIEKKGNGVEVSIVEETFQDGHLPFRDVVLDEHGTIEAADARFEPTLSVGENDRDRRRNKPCGDGGQSDLSISISGSSCIGRAGTRRASGGTNVITLPRRKRRNVARQDGARSLYAALPAAGLKYLV